MNMANLGRLSLSLALLLSGFIVEVVENVAVRIPPQPSAELHQNPANVQHGGVVMQPLVSTEECKQDVQLLCNKHTTTDWEAIECLQADEKTLSSVSEKCQNLIWQRKQIMTKKGEFEKNLPPKCLEEFRAIEECNKLGESSFYVPCLVENKMMVKKKSCISHLNRVGAFIFADYRLVYHFVNSCTADIERYKCGRIETGPVSPTEELNHLAVKSQGNTIRCLRSRIEKLEDQCRTQIFRVAELQSDDYHLDRPLFYACREDRERLCPNVNAGDGLVYACLKEHKFDPKMSEGCRSMIVERQKLRALDYFIDFRLVKSCSVDLVKTGCQSNHTSKSDATLSRMMLCLEETETTHLSKKNALVKPRRLQPECKGELFKIRQEMLEDYRLSPDLISHCEPTIERYCSSKKNGRGTMLHCLLHGMRSYSVQRPSAECEKAVYALVKVTNAEENVILDPVIDRACQPILNTKCAGKANEGHGELFECLSSHLYDVHMPKPCRLHLLELFYFVTRDVNLDDHLHRSCAEDSLRLCNIPQLTPVEDSRPDARLLTCLYNHRRPSSDKQLTDSNMTSVLSAKCQTEVMRVVHLRAASVSLEPRVFEVCLADLASCPEEEDADDEDEEDDEDDVGEGSYKQPKSSHENKGSSGLACLQDRLDSLQPKCRQAVEDISAEAQEDPNLDGLIAEACVPAEDRFCSGIRNPEDVLECLIRQKNHPKMERSCRAAIEHMQLVALKDIKISPKFGHSCSADVQKYCKDEISKGTAAVVICLSAQLTAYRVAVEQTPAEMDKHELKLPSPLSHDCENQLVFQLYERGESIVLDPELADACRTDQAKFCGNVPPGDARVLDCLRVHRNDLSSQCHAKLFQRDKVVAADNRADYSLFKACQQMIFVHCAPVVAKLNEMGEEMDEQMGRHILFECLTDALDRPDTHNSFDPICRRHLDGVMELRTKDYRLDPELQKMCRTDISKFCLAEAESTLKSPYEQNGPVLHCLKQHFVESTRSKNMLSRKCYYRVRVLIKWENTANHLDPVLAGACKADILKSCPRYLSVHDASEAELMDSNVRDCLKDSLKLGKLESKACMHEVVLMLKEAKSDVHVDPVLHRACSLEVQQICGEIEPGQGRQMTCLLRVLDRKDAATALGPECLTKLTQRRDLWNYVAQMQQPESIGELVYQVGASRSRNYILIIAFAFLTAIFIVGLCCGRVTKRVAVEAKTK